MNQAIIAAVKVCLDIAQPVCMADSCTVGSDIGVVYSYPPGYERCPDLIRERDREEAAFEASLRAGRDAEYREAYRRGLRALEEGK